MSKHYKVIVSSRASRQLIKHVEFLSRRSVNAANRLLGEYKSTIQELKENPFQFPIAPDWDSPDAPHVALFAKRYQLYFDIEGQSVFIVAVRDCRQNPIEY